MITGRVAGHEFVNGRCPTCGRRWADIRDVDVSAIGLHGIAEHGELNLFEVNQIVEFRTREVEACAKAMGSPLCS
jgi:hypothetical protein